MAEDEIIRRNIANQIQEMTMFIGRPEAAYRHIVDEMSGSKAVIKACLCFFESREDEPKLFAESLAVLLKVGRDHRLQPDLLNLKQTFSLCHIDVDPLAHESKEAFYLDCLNKIWDKLSISDNKPNSDATNDNKVLIQEYQSGIIRHLQIVPRPIVFLAQNILNWKIRLALFFGRRLVVNKINERYQWLAQFNQEWDANCSNINRADIKSMVILIFLQVGMRISDAKRVNRCMCLIKITNKEFSSWLNEVHHVLGKINQFSDRAINQVITEFDRHYEALNPSLPFNQGFKLSYRKFNDHAEKYPQPRKKI